MDYIEKELEINAPVSKVWKALTDHEQFGAWFKVSLEGPFVAGKTTRGKNLSKGFEFPMEFHVEKVQPESFFSYRWIPFPIDRKFDYSKEEPTLVEFRLEKTDAGTLLKVKESGFTKITASRRAEAFKMHTGGWEAQLRNIGAYVGQK